LAESNEGIPYWMTYSVDWRGVVFAIGVAVVAALAATLMPAWRAGRIASSAAMRDGGYGSTGAALGRLGRVLVVGEIALCAILLVSAGLTVRSIVKVQQLDLGADTSRVLTGRIAMFEQAYPDDAKVSQFFESLETKLRTVPGAAQATVTSSIPATFSTGTYYLRDGEAAPADGRLSYTYLVSIAPSYFETFHVKLLRGRGFDVRDSAGAAPVAIINQALAQKLWPGQDPIGKRLDLDPEKADNRLVEIVGLAPVVVQSEPDGNFRDALYVPLAQHPQRYMSIALRSAGDPYASPTACAPRSPHSIRTCRCTSCAPSRIGSPPRRRRTDCSRGYLGCSPRSAY
jgi:putative ABC transport system permease protein